MQERGKPLCAYFGATPLARIGIDSVMGYVAHRKGQGIGNRTINMEIGELRRVLKRGKRWQSIADDWKPLPEHSHVGRALALDEKLRLIRTAKSRPEWDTTRLAMMLAPNTATRSCELRGLRWGDVDFMGRMLTIRRSKTEAGERQIPLNSDAVGAILELRERIRAFFGDNVSPDWLVLPHAEGYFKPDPTRPMGLSGWRTARRSLTRAAGLPGLRFHDLRHDTITELAGCQASDQTIMAIAGHVSPPMLAHYWHVRLEAERQALNGLATRSGSISTTGSGADDAGTGTSNWGPDNAS